MRLGAGYFDESVDDLRAYAVAGYVGDSGDCLHAEWAWRSLLEKHNLAFFKASDCEGGYGEFAQFRDDPSDKKRPLNSSEKARLAAIDIEFMGALRRFNVVGFGAAVLQKDFQEVINSDPFARKVLTETPYFIAFQATLMAVGQFISIQNRQSGIWGQIKCIFDSHEEHSGRALKMYDEFTKKNPMSTKFIGGISYESDKEYPLIQAADNLAGECRKELLRSEYSPQKSERKAFVSLREQVRRVYKFDKETLEIVVKHQKSQPSKELMPASLEQRLQFEF
jgi:hypothetical protein